MSRHRLQLLPISLWEARAFVGKEHRHRKKIRGGKFALGATFKGQLVGVVIVGRTTGPTSDRLRAEVTRLATNGHHNACSFLYRRARRVVQAMGYTSLKTYNLTTESGASLRAIGAQREFFVKAREWNRRKRPRAHQGGSQSVDKWRWELIA